MKIKTVKVVLNTISIVVFLVLAVAVYRRINSATGFYKTPAGDMSFSVDLFGTKTYYAGGKTYLKIDSRGGGVANVSLVQSKPPSDATMQLVDKACSYDVVDKGIRLQRTEFQAGGITFTCHYIDKSVFDLIPGQRYALYPGGDSDFATLFPDTNNLTEQVPVPAGSIAEIVSFEAGRPDHVYIRYNNQYYWAYYGVGVWFFVPQPSGLS